MKSDIATYGVSTQQIDGTVAGDVFRFRQRNGNVVGEVTVSGDEMTGQGSFAGSSRSLLLRRVDPSTGRLGDDFVAVGPRYPSERETGIPPEL